MNRIKLVWVVMKTIHDELGGISSEVRIFGNETDAVELYREKVKEMLKEIGGDGRYGEKLGQYLCEIPDNRIEWRSHDKACGYEVMLRSEIVY